MQLTDSNEIRKLLYRHGFHFSKALGQNFLIASWVPEKIAENSLASPETFVIEIGAGIGCLTEQLSLRAGKVISYELDRRLKPLLEETLCHCQNVKLQFEDVMKTDLQLLIEKESNGLLPIVCANLPYQITSPVIIKLLECKSIETITLMIQKEVAVRICASPGESDYGAFGIRLQWETEPEILFDVPPSCFLPQPSVTSSVIRLRRRSVPPAAVHNEKAMFRIVRAAFGLRRKTLANALSSQIRELSREDVEKALSSCGLDTRIRGEMLSIEQFARLSDEIFP